MGGKLLGITRYQQAGICVRVADPAGTNYGQSGQPSTYDTSHHCNRRWNDQLYIPALENCHAQAPTDIHLHVHAVVILVLLVQRMEEDVTP